MCVYHTASNVRLSHLLDNPFALSLPFSAQYSNGVSARRRDNREDSNQHLL